MNYYVALPLLAAIASIITTTYVFAQNWRSPINRAYIFLSIFFVFWMFSDVIIWSPIEPSWILPLIKLQGISWIPLGFLFTNFTYTLLQKNRNTVYHAYLLAVVCGILIAIAGDFVFAGYKREAWGIAIVAGPLFVPIAFMVAAGFLYSLALIFANMRRTSDLVKKRQAELILAGTGIAVLVIVVTAVVFPHLFNLPILPLTHLGIVVHLGFIFVAIVKYRFFSIGVEDVANNLFSNVHDGVLILDSKAKVLQMNDAARAMLELTPTETRGPQVSMLLDHYFRRRNFSVFETTLGAETHKRFVEISSSPIKQAYKKVGHILFIRDLTRQKHAENEIRRVNIDLAKARDQALQASYAKSAFLANMSHELRTPLNAIIGFSEILLEETDELQQPNTSADLEKIHRAGHHLLSLINDILDISKIEAGKMDLYVEDFEIAPFIEEVVGTIQPLIDKDNNILVVDHQIDIGSMRADITKVRQILLNLISNATKFTGHGNITLTVTREFRSGSNWIFFTVQDTGIGLSPEQQAHLFQSFSQADPSTTRRYGGTGLGLAISQRFCHLMGGTITIDSKIGAGSTFTIHLPADVTEPHQTENGTENVAPKPIQPTTATSQAKYVPQDSTTECC